MNPAPVMLSFVTEMETADVLLNTSCWLKVAPTFTEPKLNETGEIANTKPGTAVPLTARFTGVLLAVPPIEILPPAVPADFGANVTVMG